KYYFLLHIIIGVLFIGQHEATEISDGGALTATVIAQNAGYPAESYDVTTQDGYVLRMDRVPGSRKSPPNDNKTAVLLVHGLLDASPTWLVEGAEKSLGTYYQINHFLSLFPLFEIILHMLDKRKFKIETLHRTRFSLGKMLCVLADHGYSLTKSLGFYEFKPSNRLIQMIGWKICSGESPLQPEFIGFLDLFACVHKKLNATLSPLITQYFPAGAAIKQLAHFVQLYQSGKFRKFDYGRAGNIEMYDKTNSPDYNLRIIRLPVYLHYATSDIIADVQDVLELYEMLPNAQKFLLPCDVFAHLDFV
ncbi:lipase 3-like, partial [Frieseomelitta varia]|uniref:lipase 3-like n=1 Tax=Frieseomelitta varia TaxID=561572 RepID=UPI001CB68F43